MVGSDQGGRSSRPLSASQKKKLRNRLRKLDRRCAAAERLMRFQLSVGWSYEDAGRIYQKSDMERMMTRNRIKGYE